MQIKDLDSTSALNRNDVLVLDNEGGTTKKISYEDLCKSIVNSIATTSTSVNVEGTKVADAVAIANLASSVSSVKSHVGMIIHSTKLDTMQKVIDVYGGTTWVKIEGRFLLGQSSSYAVNSTGGNKDAIIPYHSHEISQFNATAASAGSHKHGAAYWNANFGSGSNSAAFMGEGGSTVLNNHIKEAGVHTHNVTIPAHSTASVGTSGNITNANMPPYKTVYIWERTA